MASVSYARHQFPPVIIRHAIWLHLRFSLSYRDVGDLLAERGLDVSYETVRRWVLKFGVPFARELRKRRPTTSSQWHLDELVKPRVTPERLEGAVGVRRDKAALSSGCKSHPAYRSSRKQPEQSWR